MVTVGVGGETPGPVDPNLPASPDNDSGLGIDISVTRPPSFDIAGTGGSEFIRAGEGDQAIDAGGGDDVVYGDNDWGGGGKDFIDGGTGNDQITGGDDDDAIIGGEGQDTIYGDFQSPSADAGNDVIDAGSGNDTVIAGDGDDQIAGGSGDDLIQGDFDWVTTGGSDIIDAGDGSDFVIGGSAGDTIAGGSGDDTIYGDYRWDTSSGGGDVIAGGEGDDSIYAGVGDDTVVFSGSRDQYEITQNSDGSYTVRDLVDGRDGTDRVYDAENFRFSDGDVPADDILEGGGGGLGPGSVTYPVDIDVTYDGESGSATLVSVTIDLSNLPEGVVFSAGTVQDGKLVLTPDELEHLTMTVPDGTPPFDLDVSGTLSDSTEASVTLEVDTNAEGQGGSASGEFHDIDLQADAGGGEAGTEGYGLDGDGFGVEADLFHADGGEAEQVGRSTDVGGTDAGSADAPSAVSDYLALAETPSHEDAQQPAPGGETSPADDYAQFVADVPDAGEAQEPLAPDDLDAVPADPVQDDGQPMHDAGDMSSAEQLPDMPPAWDQDDH